MRFLKIILLVSLLAGLSSSVMHAQEAAPGSKFPPRIDPATTPASPVEAKAEGLPPIAPTVFHIGSFPVSNSMLVTWIVALIIIIFAQVATRNMKDVPDGAQNFWEFMVEGLSNFLSDIVGPDLVKTTFWFFATIFIFIFFTNWFGLLPGVGTMGWGVDTAQGFELTRPWFRGGNADLNMTFAMSAVFMACWFYWALRANGVGGFLHHIFGPKGNLTGFLGLAMMVAFFLVGFIEVISIAFRPVSLSFRLFGNVFAGENLLDAMSHAVTNPPWAKTVFSALMPVPFYFLELLVGFVQAIVFMLLTAVFTGVMCLHDEEPHH